MKYHLMRKPAASACKESQCSLRNVFCRSAISLYEPTKFFPLSLQRFLGKPLRETNLLMAAIHAALLRSETSSRLTASLAKHSQRDLSGEFGDSLQRKGLAKSRPTSSKAFRGGSTLSLEDLLSTKNWLRVEAITIDTMHYHFSNQISAIGNPETSSKMGNCLASPTM